MLATPQGRLQVREVRVKDGQVHTVNDKWMKMKYKWKKMKWKWMNLNENEMKMKMNENELL